MSSTAARTWSASGSSSGSGGSCAKRCPLCRDSQRRRPVRRRHPHWCRTHRPCRRRPRRRSGPDPRPRSPERPRESDWSWYWRRDRVGRRSPRCGPQRAGPRAVRTDYWSSADRSPTVGGRIPGPRNTDVHLRHPDGVNRVASSWRPLVLLAEQTDRPAKDRQLIGSLALARLEGQFGATLDAERGNQVFVQLHPYGVAGVRSRAVDPRELTVLCTFEGSQEALVITAEAGQPITQFAAQRFQLAAKLREAVQHPPVPRRIRMVIDRERVSAAGPQLPVRTGAHKQPVVREEFLVG